MCSDENGPLHFIINSPNHKHESKQIMPVVKSESTKTMLQKQLHLVMDVSEGCKSRLRRMTQSKGKGGSMLDMLLKQTEEKEKTLDEKERKKRVTRNHVAGEVYSTERKYSHSQNKVQPRLIHTHTSGAYVTNLKILQSRYVDPLREASKTSLPILSVLLSLCVCVAYAAEGSDVIIFLSDVAYVCDVVCVVFMMNIESRTHSILLYIIYIDI